MYTVAKGPTNLLQKSRRGVTNLENCNDVVQKSVSPSPDTSASKCQEQDMPQLVFHCPTPDDKKSRRREGRRSKQVPTNADSNNVEQEEAEENVQKEKYRELVSFLSQSWSQVRTEIESDCGMVRYLQEAENPQLLDFQPFDLDFWMQEKLYNSIMAGI